MQRKDQGYGGAVTEKELREEIEKAKTFEPPLQVFVLATTAPNDVVIQRVARTISQEHTQQGLFEVRVQGWDTLQQRITDYPEVLRKHYPDLAPVDVTAKIDASIAVTERESEQTRTELARLEGHLTAIGERLDAGGDPLQAQITQAAKLIDDGSAHAAIRALRRIQEEQGNKVTGRNLYRLHSGIGFAHMALGELPEAIQQFREAYKTDPEWPSAQSTLSIAELLEGERAAAFERAKQALRDDASLYQAASVLIDAAPADMAVADIEALVPDALRDRVDIAMGLSLRARRRGDFEAAEAYVRRVMTPQPSDLRVLSTLAEVILEPILSIPGIGLTRLVPPEYQVRFDDALDLLQRSWEQLKSRDDVWRYDHVVANLTTTLDVAGRESESVRILEDALRIAPRSTPLLRRHAQKLAQGENWERALVSIESITGGIEPPDELLRIHCLLRTGRADIALNDARALYDRLADDRMREAAASLRIEAASALGSLQAELDATLPAFPTSIVLRSVATGLLGEVDGRRKTLLIELDGLISGITDPHDRFYAAESLYRAKQYSRAADLYAGLHGTDKDDPALRRRLTALYFADRRREARKLFDSLGEQIKTLPQYAEIGAAIYELAGLLAECRAILERSLLHQEDLQRRLQWLSLSERLNQPDVVVDWLNKVPPDQQGRPRDLMMLALTMDRYLGDPTKCLPIAYRALRAAFDDPQIHLGYISIFLRGRIGRGQIDTPTEVARDTAVVLAEKGGERGLTRILETEPNPRVDRDEVSPDDALAIRLIGLRVGDEVETKALGIDSITYVVTTIQNKYVHAHFRSLERFEVMFPESRAFGSFKVDPTKGEDSFKPIFDAVKRRGEFARQIEDMYRSGQLPLAIGAKLGGSDGLEFWESIHGHPGLQFNVAVGNREDYEVARQLLQGNRRAVIDPITLWGLVRLRIADIVRSSFGDLGIVQTALDLLRRTVQKRRDNRGVEQGTLAWDGEHYRMTKLGPEAIEYCISEAEAVLAFAETLTLVPAEAAVEVPDEARKLYEDLDPAYFDTILAARGDNRVLLSDDRPFRALATEAIGIAGIWSQAAVMSGSVLQRVTADDYCKVAVTLAEAGYFYTSVNCGTFMYALRQSNWALTPTVNALIDWLARPQNEPLGLLGVLSELIRVGWALKPDDRQFEDFFAALFAGFNRADPKRDLAGLVQMAFSNVDGLMHRQLLRTRFAEELRNSTYHTPVAVAMAEIDGLRQRVGSRIALSLSNALRRAVSRNSEASPVSV